MTGRPIRKSFQNFGLAAVAAAMTVTAMPAMAQDSGEEARIRKLEAEVRALQRRVFPGADGRFFEPEVTAQAQQGSQTAALPSTTAVTDILARLDALEAQLQRLTGQYEETSFATRQLTTRVEALEARATAAPSIGTGVPTGSASGSGTSATRPASTGGSQAASTPAASSGPSAERLAAVRAIAKPQTDDAADDEYSYGFRLWDAGYFPEAIQQLTMFVEKYPNHSRATFGRNLLGRAYLDDGKPNEAAPWFLRNYQADKSAARAGDSLLYLGEAMIALNDTNRACIALAEFAETYPALASGRLQSQYAANRAKVNCN
ncbi:tetratricopeptide repeat protein [Qipengyuania spongiae]|uniref:Tetratricopeptide repeat protein n=1 Tax=Qipengyuania spongiae TaxID=2909673 RepID=A0ABY5T4Q2_9SPHN|nr:tetratricopeptide repeat protein [Qipengyuania spongiae]UVI40323.1 tetratricopeptide repeat protein [Qipengyuania spongiae]